MIVATAVLNAMTLAALAAPPSGQPGPAPEVTHLEHLRVIAIDPGHGGANTGCLGVDGTYEKEIVLDLAVRVERLLLEETDAVALLTRRSDAAVGLRQRAEMANRWQADVFLSLHLNSDAYGRGKGVETWYIALDAAQAESDRTLAHEEVGTEEAATVGDFEAALVQGIVQDAILRKAQADSERLAIEVARAMWASTKTLYRGVNQDSFGVLKSAQMPAIVVEAGFFSHKEEGWQLLDPAYRDKIARGIVDGLVAYDRKIGGRAPIRVGDAAP